MVPSAIIADDVDREHDGALASLRESIWIQTQSLSESWSRRVSFSMIGVCT